MARLQQAVDYRRNTAAQYFIEETPEEVSKETIIQLIGNSSIPNTSLHHVLKNLQIIKQILLYKEPRFLDNFLDEVVSFQEDSRPCVREFVVDFIKDTCLEYTQQFPKLVGNLDLLLEDPTSKVQKRVIRAAIKLYAVVIRWLCSTKTVTDLMEATWKSFEILKNKILAQLDSANEGVRTMVLKFMECVITAQTHKDPHPKMKTNDLSLDDIPVILKIFRPRKLKEEAAAFFAKMVEFHSLSHVSSCNLMICMQSLTNIARKRFEYFPEVLQAFESLQANLPPTLSQCQVTSVRKMLKRQICALARHPSSAEFHSRISIMLTDLGATAHQISKLLPAAPSKKEPLAKQPRFGYSRPTSSAGSSGSKETKSVIEVTAKDLMTKLTNLNVADLVLVTMLNLPEEMPAHFQSTFIPISAAGTEPQIQHLARLFAAQLTVAGLGRGVETMTTEGESYRLDSDEEDELSSKKIQTVVGMKIDSKPKKRGLVLMPSGNIQLKKTKRLDLNTAQKTLASKDRDKFARAAYRRILGADVAKYGGSEMRIKLLVGLATQFEGDFSADLKNHIMENPRNRIELALSWLFEEYSAYKGFQSTRETPIERYEDVVNLLLELFLEIDDAKHQHFSRFFLEVPYVSEGMAECLKKVCTSEILMEYGFSLAEDMAFRRVPKKLLFLGVISELTLHSNKDISSRAVEATLNIYRQGQMRSFIEAFASRCLRLLLESVPSSSNFEFFPEQESWSEDLAKIALSLYLTLLPLNHHLIKELAVVYVETSQDIKKTILRVLEAPVKEMGMSSPDLLHLVENCPKGAETLVTRIVHILTDKYPPSAELVARVRELYKTRVQDIRFLIPVVHGLTKSEVVATLPEMIKLNPTVVKEVFHRLLSPSSPLSPEELMIALHCIDASKCNVKIVIKATSLCFDEKSVFTQSVLAVVIRRLMEMNPLPLLLMRTVIQSLAHYPNLLGSVTNVLQRLIVRQVWQEPKIWEGFIKCCQRTKPQSFQVLLQLPAAQLREILTQCPDLRVPFCVHVQGFTDHQKEHIPEEVAKVIRLFTSCDKETSEF